MPPKYRNPANPEETWSGHARKPGWLVDALRKRGVTLDQFLIAAPAKRRGRPPKSLTPKG
jgi:DNA-binding protein H-NS